MVTIDKTDPKKREVKWTPSPAKIKPEEIEVRKDSVFPESIPTILHIDCREELSSPKAVEIARARTLDSFVYMDTGDLKEHTIDLIGKTRPDGIQMPKRCAIAICQQNGINKLSSLEELVNGVRQIVGTKDDRLQFLVVTDGENGSAYCYRNSQTEDFITGSQPAYQVKTVDSNGAGDIFAGGISYARTIMGMIWEDSVKFASATAAIKCEKLGRSGNIPTENQVIEFQKQY